MLKPLAVSLLLIFLQSIAHAEQLGSVSTKFHMLGPNDKVVIEAFDDPAISGPLYRPTPLQQP